MSQPDRHVLTITCPDATGLVAAVAGFLRDQSCFIDESNQYGDPSTNRFFMRAVFTRSEKSSTAPQIKSAFETVALSFGMAWEMTSWHHKPRVLVAVSNFGHCLNDMLHRWNTGQLAVDIVGVISNHDTLRSVVERDGIPYHHFPVAPSVKAAQESQVLDLFDSLGGELLVLARYMQVLSAEACERLAGRCINIHHSFLPSFKGAKPYQQAFDRGVKIIGATAHYVTPNLDEGPIIDQAVERVDHTHTVADMVSIGRDLENVVLARAVRYHAQRRVLINASKTIVFK